MSGIMSFSNAAFSIDYILVDGVPWFKGKEVATLLGYANTKNAIINNVRDQDKRKMEELRGPPKDPWTITPETQCTLANQVSMIWSSTARKTKPRTSEDG